MSYILDALRRADAERERGAVPGIHAQPIPAGAGDAKAPSAARQWLWIGLGLGVGLIAALGGFFATREAPLTVAGAPAADAAATPPAAGAAVPAVTAPERPPAVAPPAPIPLPKVAAAKTGASDAAPAARIYTRDALPEAVRSQLPPLAIGGAMYSANPANRSLIVDGRLVREGEQIAPELSLERIKLKAAVLRFRGYLFEVAF